MQTIRSTNITTTTTFGFCLTGGFFQSSLQVRLTAS